MHAGIRVEGGGGSGIRSRVFSVTLCWAWHRTWKIETVTATNFQKTILWARDLMLGLKLQGA